MRIIKRGLTFFYLLLLVVMDVSLAVDQSACQLSFPEMTNASEESHANVTESVVQNCDIYSNIFGIMEELNIIAFKKTSCYTMKWISRKVASKSSDRSRGITITFQIEEHFDSNLKIDSASSQGFSEMKSADSVTTTVCHSLAMQPRFKGQQSMAMVHVNNTGENDDNSNITGILVPTQNNGNNRKEHGLSHTQVVVIATCSAVIGTFFIVAAVLRIRNYIKRWREQQVVAPPDYHPCLGRAPSVPSKETQEIRTKDPNTNKTTSRQSSSTVKGGNRYYPVNNHEAPSSPTMSPKHCFLDSNPVLVVTAPSSISPSPTDSHASIQFIDEEADKDVSPKPCPAADVPVETEDASVKSPSPVSDCSISSEGEVCNEDIPKPQVAAPVTTAPSIPVVAAPVTSAPSVPVVAAPMMAIEASPGVEQEKLLGNRSDSVSKNPVVPSQDLNNMMSFDTSPTDASSPSDVEMISPELLFVTAGLTQSDESLSCSHNAFYSYGNQVEYSNSLYNTEDCYFDNEVDMDTCSTTPDDDSKQNGSSVTSETGNMISNGLASDDPSSSLSSPPSSPLSENTNNNTQNNIDTCGNLVNMTSYPDNRDVIRPNSLNHDTRISNDIMNNGAVQSQMNMTGNVLISTDDHTCET
ncbi:probable serine/threonine-protein kinase nek3 [Ylistrum balloti]|uniref:probable serine/threonine-protein kinase nek3 n=1 Tax=Ylistrum balloti TaxID=509963 RepID=UPI002905F3E0|nr:probable serine/threonine-protein kinase nek3 [Ylistrum balloti]